MMKMDTQDRINLGQAKNQASSMMADIIFKMPSVDRKETYKALVRFFHSANKEIDEEFLKTGGEGKGLTRDVISPITTKATSVPSPSPKQKYCPKCNIIIPKTWKKHIECGWVE